MAHLIQKQRTDFRVAYLQMQEPSKLTGSIFNFKKGLAVVFSIVGLILADSVLHAKKKNNKRRLGEQLSRGPNVHELL